jgi:tripartite-type tricarboxylate transporter receptor subunit TctC
MIVEKLNAEFTAALSSPDIREALLKQGTVAEPGPPADLGRKITSDLKKWRDLVDSVGVTRR